MKAEEVLYRSFANLWQFGVNTYRDCFRPRNDVGQGFIGAYSKEAGVLHAEEVYVFK